MSVNKMNSSNDMKLHIHFLGMRVSKTKNVTRELYKTEEINQTQLTLFFVYKGSTELSAIYFHNENNNIPRVHDGIYLFKILILQ